MYSAPNRCPICQSELVITRLTCPSCDTALEGRFRLQGPFANLSAEQLEFIEVFVRCEGKFTRMESELGLSYPTIRNRLYEIIRAMGYEPGKETSPPLSEEERRRILEDLDAGKITAEEALKALRGEGEDE
ncbi:MAG: DUF2089 domain-containing protein [Anaerolineae bacterium]|nr:MAG: DUF2089 domain-containing protein [Anaerolineae bacterium]